MSVSPISYVYKLTISQMSTSSVQSPWQVNMSARCSRGEKSSMANIGSSRRGRIVGSEGERIK